jgi:hypothetical protein
MPRKVRRHRRRYARAILLDIGAQIGRYVVTKAAV